MGSFGSQSGVDVGGGAPESCGAGGPESCVVPASFVVAPASAAAGEAEAGGSFTSSAGSVAAFTEVRSDPRLGSSTGAVAQATTRPKAALAARERSAERERDEGAMTWTADSRSGSLLTSTKLDRETHR